MKHSEHGLPSQARPARVPQAERRDYLDDMGVRRAFHKLLEAAGLPRIRFQDLRHAFRARRRASASDRLIDYTAKRCSW